MTTDSDCAIHGGTADTCRDTERALRKKIDRLTAEHRVMVEALEKLSRLGNEPHLGNSDGNKIAQRAIAAVSGSQRPECDHGVIIGQFCAKCPNGSATDEKGQKHD